MSITAVPLRPIGKGALTKLWLGLAVAALAGGGLAVAGTAAVRDAGGDNSSFLAANATRKGVVTTPSGLQYQVLKPGKGKSPTQDDIVLVGYRGTLRDGKVFDENPQVPFPVAGVVPGFSEGLRLMQVGGKYRLWIKPELGYGDSEQTNPQTGEVTLPANSLLIFDVTLIDFKTRAEVQAMQAEMQARQQQGGQPMPGQPPVGQPPAGMPGPN